MTGGYPTHCLGSFASCHATSLSPRSSLLVPPSFESTPHPLRSFVRAFVVPRSSPRTAVFHTHWQQSALEERPQSFLETHTHRLFGALGSISPPAADAGSSTRHRARTGTSSTTSAHVPNPICSMLGLVNVPMSPCLGTPSPASRAGPSPISSGSQCVVRLVLVCDVVRDTVSDTTNNMDRALGGIFARLVMARPDGSDVRHPTSTPALIVTQLAMGAGVGESRARFKNPDSD
ncbi:hypothetical protein C8R45DRAFT_1157962 [Mycena sanguinolenta]|nr:hypothetical protein C8R45DRAFT_1157962 [Mycena sanguinolenta]